MILRSLLLADAVDVGSSGKVFIHGGAISRIFAGMIPWTHPSIAVFARLQAESEEVGDDHRLSIKFLGSDGTKVVAGAEASFRVVAPTDQSVALQE